MLHFEMVLLECHDQSTNQGLMSGIRFEPGRSLVVNPQVEFSGAKISVILQNYLLCCVHFELGSSKLRLSGIQLFAPVHNLSQAPFALRTMPLMQNARNCNRTGICVQHKLALAIRLHQGNCLKRSQLIGIKCLLLLTPPGECRECLTHACNNMQGATSLACQVINCQLNLAKPKKLCSFVLFLGTSQTRSLDTAFGSRLIPSTETKRPGILIFDFISRT